MVQLYGWVEGLEGRVPVRVSGVVVVLYALLVIAAILVVLILLGALI